jgi:polyhydroxyalkanoate synthesis regulator phasin
MQHQMTDTSVRVPAAVKASAARADELFRVANGLPDPNAQPQDGQDVDPNAQPQEGQQPAAEHPQEGQQPLTAEQQFTREGKPGPADENDESWKSRYLSMKGRFDRLQEQTRPMAEQIDMLQRQMAALEARAAAPAQVPAEMQAARLITPQEEQDYGSEFLQVVGKKAKEELSPEVEALKNQVKSLEAKIEGVNGYVATDAKSRMLAWLDGELPSWRAVNRADEFKSWLALPDPYSGVIRLDLLKAAYGRNDGPRVLAFFKGFLAEEATVAPAADPQQPGAQQPANRPRLEDFAAPGRAKTAAGTNTPAEKPVFTRAQIAKFYADVRAGKYRNDAAEKDRLEREFFQAERDGRIR